MDRLYFEVPGISRREDAAAFINEFYEYGSEINGTGGLQHFAENYEGWLEKLERDYTDLCPGPGERPQDRRHDQYPPGAERASEALRRAYRLQHPAYGAGERLQQPEPVPGAEGLPAVRDRQRAHGRRPRESRLLEDDGGPGRGPGPGVLRRRQRPLHRGRLHHRRGQGAGSATSPSSRTSSPPASRTASAPSTGLASSAPSTP